MRVGVLVSGRGSNLRALLDASGAGELAPAQVVCVVSSRAEAPALQHAQAAGVATAVVEPAAHPERAAFDAAVRAVLEAHRVQAVVLAGFMRILGAEFVNAYADRLINTHPSLLPAFPGLNAPAQALAHGVKLTGCTVHFVEAGLDSGPIIAQVAIPVLAGDDAATLHRRIQTQEHRLLPEVTQLLAAGRLRRDGRSVWIADAD